MVEVVLVTFLGVSLGRLVDKSYDDSMTLKGLRLSGAICGEGVNSWENGWSMLLVRLGR